MSMRERIIAHLQALQPIALEVIDESEQHRGHGGWREGGDTHFRVIIRSAAFDHMSRIEQHRRVNALLKPEFEKGLHALAVVSRGSSEA
ncbi:MAG: BolA family transcriptional regulator [Rhizobiales bacterium]|jgi:BolA protein|nr:BolA family transcriptional regulator [Hyphomicrobiales bacterium]